MRNLRVIPNRFDVQEDQPLMDEFLVRGRMPSRIHAEWVETGYLRELDAEPEFLRIWPIIRDLTMLDIFRARSIFRVLSSVISLPGDIVECGSWRGGIGILMGLLVRDLGLNKKVFLCDSFAGLPSPDPSIDRQYSLGEFVADVDALASVLNDLGLNDVCQIRKGPFVETLPTLAANRTLCFVHVDCDLHHSALNSINLLYPCLASQGAMVFDDYYDGSGGIALAVNEHVTSTKEIVYLGPPPQAILFKGRREDPHEQPLERVQTEDHCVLWSTALVSSDDVYQSFLSELQEFYEQSMTAFSQFADMCRGGTLSRPTVALRCGEQPNGGSNRDWKRFLFTPGKPVWGAEAP